jgi:nitroimidazol reductase NimA-like FMN-containing flavoprotein (pyridoxamine 5'-phosphate oxidase superfamily)
VTQRAVAELSAEDCLTLLKSCHVGRIVFVDDNGPGAVPVNYGVAADEIIVRVEEDSSLRRLIQNPIGFEVDRTDPQQSEAWSVLVRGKGREVPLADVADLLELMHENLPRPWAEGIHNHWLAIRIVSVTGRRLSGSFHAALY